MIRKISTLLTVVIVALGLNGCTNKIKDKNDEFDSVKRKIQNNHSGFNKSMYKDTSSNSINNGINKEAIKELVDFEERIKNDNDLLRKAYKEKINSRKSDYDILLKEKCKLAMSGANNVIKNIKDKSEYMKELQKQQESIKEQFKKLSENEKKKYENNKSLLDKAFQEYDNKIKDIESKRDIVIRAMMLDWNNVCHLKKGKENIDKQEANINDSGKKELKKYKDEINAIIKLRNQQLKNIK